MSIERSRFARIWKTGWERVLPKERGILSFSTIPILLDLVFQEEKWMWSGELSIFKCEQPLDTELETVYDLNKI